MRRASVLVQTFQPESRAVALAARHDVAGFLAGELERRRELGYPPFRHLVRILVSGPEQADPLQALTELAAGLESADAEIARARRRSSGFVVATEPSSSRRPRDRASSRRGRAGSCRPQRRRCGRPTWPSVVDVDPQGV